LEKYWNDESRFPYIIKQGEKYIGFVFVRHINAGERNYFSIVEFLSCGSTGAKVLAGRQQNKYLIYTGEGGRSFKWNPINLRRHFGGVLFSIIPGDDAAKG
jgi:predicted acetyltransferase